MNTTTPIVFLTGATRGIGALTARALAARGIGSVLLVRNVEATQAVADAVRAAGLPCHVEWCDLARPESIAPAVEKAFAKVGRIDALINNGAQVDPIGRLTDTPPAEWLRALTVNLASAYHAAHACLPLLLRNPPAADAARGRGAILNISTGAAHAPREGWSAYCSSKAGLLMLTRSMALEYGEQGIAVYGLQPGMVDTDMQSQVRASGINEVSRVPRAQLGSPTVPAAVAAWLVDQRPADLRGQDLTANDAALRERAGVQPPA